MLWTVKQAAEATGKSKPTIARLIQDHTISATKDEHGVWRLDPAELIRIGLLPVSGISLPPRTTSHYNNGASEAATEIELLRRMLSDKDGTIDDLRRRLDAEADERRRVQTQLTALLTDQREKAPDVIVTPPPTSQTNGQGPAAAPKPRKWSLFGKRESV